MSFADNLQGTLRAFDKNGKLLQTAHNTITRCGKDYITRSILGYKDDTKVLQDYSLYDPFTGRRNCKTTIAYAKFGQTQLSDIKPVVTRYTDNNLVQPIYMVKNANEQNQNIFEIPNSSITGKHIYAVGTDNVESGSSEMYSYDETLGISNVSYEFTIRYSDFVPFGETNMTIAIIEVGLFLATYDFSKVNDAVRVEPSWKVYASQDELFSPLTVRTVNLYEGSGTPVEAMFARIATKPLILEIGTEINLQYTLPL